MEVQPQEDTLKFSHGIINSLLRFRSDPQQLCIDAAACDVAMHLEGLSCVVIAAWHSHGHMVE